MTDGSISNPKTTTKSIFTFPNYRFRPTTILPVLVLIDMFSVSLVVPLLQQYYRNAGVSSASQRELLSSIFSTSQIVGGLCIGYLSDAKVLTQNQILLLSFLGSAFSYGILGYGKMLGVKTVIFSRMVVGLVKQTLTVSMSMLVKYTTKEERASQLGRLNASSTIAWIVGPSVGAYLYKHVNTAAPVLLAFALFILNFIIAIIFLPSSKTNDRSSNNHDNITTTDTPENTKPKKSSGLVKFTSFFANIKDCFSSPKLGSVIFALLIFSWVRRATSYETMTNYYEEMYQMETYQRGYLQSYKSTLTLIAQSVLIQPILQFLGAHGSHKSKQNEIANFSSEGGERRAAYLGAIVLALCAFTELYATLSLFLIALSPLIAISNVVMDLSLRSTITQITPKSSINSVLAALDVLQNVAAVTVPFYRTALFQILATLYVGDEDNSNNEESIMEGDPNPRMWLLVCGFHWTICAAFIYFLMKPPKSIENKSKNMDKDK